MSGHKNPVIKVAKWCERFNGEKHIFLLLSSFLISSHCVFNLLGFAIISGAKKDEETTFLARWCFLCSLSASDDPVLIKQVMTLVFSEPRTIRAFLWRCVANSYLIIPKLIYLRKVGVCVFLSHFPSISILGFLLHLRKFNWYTSLHQIFWILPKKDTTQNMIKMRLFLLGIIH